ncbi:MAG: branched-chain-amino-acid transaminase [Planctomycetota bacterium]
MERTIYIDGKLVPESQAKVSVFDHCLLYGDGVFEGIRVYHGNIFRLGEHIRRLYDSARAIALAIPVSQEEMASIVEETCRANEVREGYVRLIVTRGVGDLGLDPWKCKNPNVICIANAITLYAEKFYEKGLELITSAVPRLPAECLNPQIKSCNYLNNTLAKIDAIHAGVVEAVMLNIHGFVAECSGDNIFLYRDGALKTPATSAGALKGITRDVVIELARGLEIPVEEPDITRYDLYTAEECFLTGTAAEIVPVIRIDGRTIGGGRPGPVTQKLRAAFQALVKGD